MSFLTTFLRTSSVLLPRNAHSTKPAPSSPGLALETGQHCPSPVPPVRFPTSTPKPRAEGSSPSAPATKPAKTLGFRRFSFFMCCIAIWCILVRISGFPTRPYRLHPSPAPGTHPVSPFSGFSGCVSLFLPSFDLQNFRLCFCASCRTAITG